MCAREGDREKGLPLCALWTFAFLLSTYNYSLQPQQPNVWEKTPWSVVSFDSKMLTGRPEGPAAFLGYAMTRWLWHGPTVMTRGFLLCGEPLHLAFARVYKLGLSVEGTSTSQPLSHGTASYTNAGKGTQTQTYTPDHPAQYTGGRSHLIQSQDPLPARHTQENHPQPGERPNQKSRAQINLPQKDLCFSPNPKNIPTYHPSDKVNTSAGPHFTSPSLSLSPLLPCHFHLHLYFCSTPCLPPSLTQTLLKPLTMSQTAKSASSQGTDAKDKGAPAPAASSKATKTGEPGMGSYRVSRCSVRHLQKQQLFYSFLCWIYWGKFRSKYVFSCR